MASNACRALVANGRQGRRRARTRKGLCGKCHALTEKGTQCKYRAKGNGEYCLNWPTHQPGAYEVKSTSAARRKGPASATAANRRNEIMRKDLSRRLGAEAAKMCAEAMSAQNLEEV